MSGQNARITVYGAPWCPDCRRAFVEAKNNG